MFIGPVDDQDPAAESNTSMIASENPRLSCPPAIRTRPLASKVAVWRKQFVLTALVAIHVPAFRSYTSTLASALPEAKPPATRTFPFGSSVAVWAYLAACIEPTGVQAFDAGSYNSALAR